MTLEDQLTKVTAERDQLRELVEEMANYMEAVIEGFGAAATDNPLYVCARAALKGEKDE